ncbi:MAG: S-adenosylmethionine:tRNA ribosyltransferase-isomerase [Chitinophagaceae bacterium]|nr:MAG: S-adenosylmethionine:tRNA ribosyltransferase-isomerase [Chitinophagaceae bacterium]
MHPSQLSISDYTYHLPADRIAEFPLPERDSSRLLLWQNGQVSEDVYRNLASHLQPGSLTVFNNSKVIEARLLFYKASGARIEIFCLEPHNQYPDLPTAMSRQGSVLWVCMVGGASKWKHGTILEKKITVNGKELILQALFSERRANDTVIELTWNDEHMSFAELLHYAGDMPLPPYIKRKAGALDQDRYQTIYAAAAGSVAAPTAGLHFTPAIFRSMDEKKIDRTYVTLHVGAGTFKPVSSEQMSGHDMHAELIDVPRETIEALLNHLPNGITAVGTTSLRTLESLYWFGIQAAAGKLGDDFPVVEQWDPYENPSTTTAAEALASLLAWMEKNGKDNFVAKTRILIAPGYRFRIINALVTNFHQPKSTLLLLIAALVGDEWKTMYRYAMDHGFRFLSYGDGCLIRLSPYTTGSQQ